MAELGFEDQIYQQRPDFVITRDASPDSVIFTSLFSSASASVDRCSFASDTLDHDSPLSQEHLAGHDRRETSSGADSDPSKSTVHRNSRSSRKVQKAKVHKEDSDADTGRTNEILASGRNSFSQALKECQDRRSGTGVLPEKPDRQGPNLQGLNNHITDATNSSSPPFGAMKNISVLTRRTGMCPSPGMPNYRHSSVAMQKGWSSERVPHNGANRRHFGAALLPLNNGRMLPSKWEDAERWICSPVTGDGVTRPSFQMPQRRPKSKSGPLGQPGIPYYLVQSPAVPTFHGASVGNLMDGSPFSAGVIAPDGFSVRSSVSSGAGGSFPNRIEPCMARSVSLHGYFELPIQSFLPGPQDEKLDGDKDAATNVSRADSRRDVATQMSPESSPHSSPKRRLSFSPSTPSKLAIVELESVESSKLEVKDVQVDDQFTVTGLSKRHKARLPGKSSENVSDWKRKVLEFGCSAWEVSETAKGISKVKREEAKITAWEKLQKAKAEAAIRKLEMKIEKTRSSSIDKIMKKLRSAQKKAQAMRSSVSTSKPTQVARTSQKVISLHRTYQISSLSGCFTCHAF
ncbi:uncharacterized protein LOC131331208 [Rhododendron vialii]|uniref:uncharacterized protein LOC131331208 n=1 Tax=Rhododendron vialii TaxID=182163 RepID=UPI00265E3CF2|nr:uncharacterized protein LOC131331208 [Rhododendron vialii]XP_058221075.1 uncharacterized protein LOC131331208 [Rhododendron vialii]